MPRGPRLDSPGALHHVIARGIERGVIFRDDHDREGILDRIARLVEIDAFAVYAWALMPNHFHLLVRTRAQPLERSMRSLLSGHASAFNRRHDRVGHLFQNRYRSTLCEDEGYFVALTRYIHRNPIPSVVPDVAALDRYPFTGHAAVLGAGVREWQDTDELLRHFGEDRVGALSSYRALMSTSADPRDLEGGGLRRSRDAWERLHEVEKGRERFRSDERILGSGAFVDSVLREVPREAPKSPDLAMIIARVCAHLGVSRDAIRGEGRSRSICRAREGVSYLWTVVLGHSRRALARFLGVAESSLQAVAKRGAAASEEWDALLQEPDRW
jgi:putative transposase